jgi:hypothetical protein
METGFSCFGLFWHGQLVEWNIWSLFIFYFKSLHDHDLHSSMHYMSVPTKICRPPYINVCLKQLLVPTKVCRPPCTNVCLKQLLVPIKVCRPPCTNVCLKQLLAPIKVCRPPCTNVCLKQFQESNQYNLTYVRFFLSILSFSPSINLIVNVLSRYSGLAYW